MTASLALQLCVSAISAVVARAGPRLVLLVIALCQAASAAHPLPSDTETLLDTLTDSEGKWTGWVTNSDDGAGWISTNSAMVGGKVMYSVCHVELSEATEFLLRSPFINARDARTIHLELRFTTRSCALFPRPENLKRCKETMELTVLHSDEALDEAALTRLSENFTRAHTVAPDVIWKKSPSSERLMETVNTKTYSVKLRARGLYLALRDTGSCMSLLQVRAFFNVCPALRDRFAEFPRTPAADLIPVAGACVGGAELPSGASAPSLLCQHTGQWFSVHSGGDCHCRPGYFAAGPAECRPCPSGAFKSEPGNGTCRTCPANSGTPAGGSGGAVDCKCSAGYYRNPSLDAADSACTKPPSAPRDAAVSENSRSRVVLTWSPPENTGSRIDIRYFVECAVCGGGGGEVVYEPGQTVTDRRVELRGLRPLTMYTFNIYALNGVSVMAKAERLSWMAVNFRTASSLPGKPESISVKVESPTAVRLSWERQPAGGLAFSAIDEYELKVYPRLDASKISFYFTKVEEYLVTSLEQGVTYMVQVRGRNSLGWGDYSDAIAVNTLIPTADPDGVSGSGGSGSGDAGANINIIIGAVVAVLLCLVIVLTMIILMTRRGYLLPFRRKLMTAEKAPQRHHGGSTGAAGCAALDCNMLPYSNSICTLTYGTRAPLPSGFQLPQQLRPYVDPHTYEDPSLAVREFAKEIDASWIAIECVLGGGEFGDVCKGSLTLPGRESQPVAIKTLKPGASDKNKVDFLTEASIMGQFDDPNVIYLDGVVTRSHPAMIVTEFMANGSLDTFLRAHDGQLSCHQLVGMLRGIASGMRYLSDMGYIHRDLAARNILVSEQLVCKVSDFGLSREVEVDGGSRDGTYTTRGGKIPIRWTAPEAIHFRKFTSATDAWSFGIVMWEVMSFGERPYWNWTNQDVIAAVENGYRLPPPMDCPEALHQLMLDCWKWERVERPKFALLVRALDRLLHQPELLTCQRSRPIYEQTTLSMSTGGAHRSASISQWLCSLRLEQYTDAFMQYGVCTIELLPRLGAADLAAMGIGSAGHQKTLLNAIEKLKLHIYEATPYSDGYLV